jgi:superfamily I DNA and RNA helicase
MMKQNLFIILACTLFIVSCKQEQVIKFEDDQGNYTWSDKNVFASTDIDNPFRGFSQEDEQSLNKQFAEFIFDAADREDVVFEDIDGNKLSKDQVKEALELTRTIKVEDPENQEEFILEQTTYTISAEDIVQVMSVEEWFFDKENFKLKKQVSKIAPVVYVLDSDGDVRGMKLLFWMRLN